MWSYVVAAVLVVGLSLVKAESDVQVLTAQNFDQLTSSGTWLLDFYTPWCGHCKQLAPIYEELATKVKGQHNIAKIDCAVEKELQTRFGIKIFPTIKLLKGGKLYNYYGHRTIDAFVAYLEGGHTSAVSKSVPAAAANQFSEQKPDEELQSDNQASKPSDAQYESPMPIVVNEFSERKADQGHQPDNQANKPSDTQYESPMPIVSEVVSLTEATFEQFISKDTWLLQFYAPWRGNIYTSFAPVYEAVAAELRGSVKVGKIDCAVEIVLCAKRDDSGILFVKDNEMRRYTSEWTLDGLTKFAQRGWEDTPAFPVPWATVLEKPRFVSMPGQAEVGEFHDLASSEEHGDKDKTIAELIDIILKFNPSALPARFNPAGQEASEKVKKFHEAVLEFGLPSKENVHFYASYVASTNYQKRIPNWGMQHLTAENTARSSIKANRDNSQFTGDVAHIPPEFRASTRDYTGSGWTRGHMVPATDLRQSQEEMDTTFHLNDNIVPQDANNNMQFWRMLEDFARDTMVKQYKDVYVVSGPAFLPAYNPIHDQAELADKRKKKQYVQYEIIGDNDVAVPTHLFKVILVPNGVATPQTYLLGAFLVPNEPIAKHTELSTFEVPVEHLERYTGLKFFQNLNRTNQIKPLCEATAVCKVN